MLDLFTIFSKGGIVLWCFQSTSNLFTPSVNALIRSVILQERTGSNSFTHDALTLKYKLDNEFELVFVVAYQKILQLSYVDKFLNDVHLEFRDKYKNELQQGRYFQAVFYTMGFYYILRALGLQARFRMHTECVKHYRERRRYYKTQTWCFILPLDFEFNSCFQSVLATSEKWGKQQAKIPKQMRTFEESSKSKKTVASMIERKGEEKDTKKSGKSKKKTVGFVNGDIVKPLKVADQAKPEPKKEVVVENGELEEELLIQNRLRLAQKLGGKNAKGKAEKQKSPKPAKEKEGKKPRIWELGGNSRDVASLDRSKDKPAEGGVSRDDIQPDTTMVGRMVGGIRDLEVDSDSDEDDDYEEEVEVVSAPKKNTAAAKKGGGMFSMFRGLVGSKNLTREGMQPVLEKLKDHLITKNVAADIAYKLCDSVAVQLEGRVLGTFDSVASTVKTTLTDALVQILSPKRRVDILRDALEAKSQSRPYTMAFCGVNGVGKSTNLAKICFWLIENNLRVLIAACDTFRAGAVEQLRTHTRHLNALHPAERHGGNQMVQLYEKGYGKDAAGIAMEAINYARDQRIDVVLIDTAGRMQDNEPLMRALAKLIKVNQPDLVLFVGEALVGNEAVDQLVKFNQALADFSSSVNPHLIDGIVLTKFDTIDDKVGAAISMTYITGQPIVFVGTGQTYTDLKSLNAKAVVHALMK